MLHLKGVRFLYCQKCRQFVTVPIGPETRVVGAGFYVCMPCRRAVMRARARYLGKGIREGAGWGACLCCGAVDDLTVDHVIPRSRGGADDSTNFQTLCRKCNSIKGDKYVDFRQRGPRTRGESGEAPLTCVNRSL